MQGTNSIVWWISYLVLYRNLNQREVFEIWIVKKISLTFAMAKDDRRERHRSLLHFP